MENQMRRRKYPPNPQMTKVGEKRDRIRTWILANCTIQRSAVV